MPLGGDHLAGILPKELLRALHCNRSPRKGAEAMPSKYVFTDVLGGMISL